MIELSKNISSCGLSDLPVKANNAYFDPILTPKDFMSKQHCCWFVVSRLTYCNYSQFYLPYFNAYFHGNMHVLDLAVIFVTSIPLGFVSYLGSVPWNPLCIA